MDIDQAKSLDEWLGLIDQHISSNTLLIGWSLGGNLAIQYAAASQKEFLGLITLQTNPCFIAKNQWANALPMAEFLALYDLVKSGDQKAVVRRFTHLLVSGSAEHKTDRKQLKRCYSDAFIKESAILLAGLNLLRDLDVRDALMDVSVPCLHLYGEKDVLIPENVASDIKALLLKRDPTCKAHQVKTLLGMAHLPCWAYRSEILMNIKDFVKTI
ncbi:MAG: pimeloyl-[acyl-carrier protein] methyl ester esterase [Oleiphilaceae bacterium]|jgi:pimeloyl-[acyl-carrier protein] methyl ester esterase